jgi:hypothetical protein
VQQLFEDMKDFIDRPLNKDPYLVNLAFDNLFANSDTTTTPKLREWVRDNFYEPSKYVAAMRKLSDTAPNATIALDIKDNPSFNDTTVMHPLHVSLCYFGNRF